MYTHIYINFELLSSVDVLCVLCDSAQLAVGVIVGLILSDAITPRGVRSRTCSWHVHAACSM